MSFPIDDVGSLGKVGEELLAASYWLLAREGLPRQAVGKFCENKEQLANIKWQSAESDPRPKRGPTPPRFNRVNR
jgi:hypothetical protein